ncbi:ARD/ARD' family protein [Dictyocaulus viviparus]|uniref:ARD/ARD' family protein n=1 Tax=Dictyocaulus viviparus TaxID=29172 RepID=A0A0D8Y1J4_DICVI|nr:ARD/ARD' family protein [Dictyocaulus viviparus]
MEPFPCGDRRLPHHIFPPKKITVDQLFQLTGVVDMNDTTAMKKRLSRVKSEREVNSSDLLTINDSIPDFDEKVIVMGKLEEYYEPTTKNLDVVALVMDGNCYYDIEPEEDEWIRIHLERGDLIVIPKGVSHRFTVTPQNYVQIQRFLPKKPDDMQG